MTSLTTTQKTMSSREIAELTGKRHGHVFRDIEKMLKELELSQEGYVQPWVDPQNKQVYHEFLLDRRLTDCLLTGYSAKARIKVIDRWQELEKANQPQVPQTYAAALLEAGRLALENERLQLEAQENAPKLEVYSALADRKGDVSTTLIAKQLGMTAIKLNKFLREKGVKWERADLPKAGYQDWFNVIADTRNGHEYTQCLVTPLGQIEIAKLINKDGK